MKYVLLLLISFPLYASELTVSGKVSSPKGCSSKAMVWLSLDKDNYNERLLLMHTEVPVGGSFSFYVKPGNYQVRGSDEAGCEFFERVSISGSDAKVSVKMEKK